MQGTVRVPGDKSISHRALLLAALADGESLIRGIADGGDVASTARVLRSLGVAVPALSDAVRVTGVGLRGLRAPRTSLDCGNSGTTARLVAGMVAAHSFSARFEGDPSLSRRPMKRIAEPLTYMGAQFEFDRADGLPMTVRGRDLRSIDWDTGRSSAQVKSAILLAGIIAGVEVRVTESIRSRDHTERMLRTMGGDVETDGNQVCLRPSGGGRLAAIDLAVPGDPSSAAMFVALAAMADEGELVIEGVCLNPTRTGFLAAVKRMGGDILVEGLKERAGEQVGSLRVRPRALRAIRIGVSEVPFLIDELPVLACLAAGCGVDLEVTGAEELRVKESDRIRTVVDNLVGVGAFAEELPDGFRVFGRKASLTGTVDGRGDHRLAMAFGVLGAVRGNRIEVRDPESVAVSYPAFWSDLKRAVA